MKAQSAIEFITAYSWALLLILVVGFIAYYYITSQQPAPQCSFGIDLQCLSYQFVKNSSGTMKLVFMLNNGMGKAVTFIGNQTITVMNIGKSGVNSYNGSCWSRNSIIRGGDPIYCTFSITDSDVIPSLNRNVKFDIALNYVDCETSPDYPIDCYGGLNRTSHGSITAPFEARPGGIAEFCGDGICTSGESCSSCTLDCGPCEVPTCQWSCAFGTVGTGICNSSCLGVSGCSRFYQACNNYAPWTNQCSDSSGGTTGPLNYYVYCCNFFPSLTSAPSCYSIDATHIGWCGDSGCDASHGENCSTCPLPQGDCPVCPSICLSNCTTGDSICHASCSGLGGCSNFKLACETPPQSWALGASRCSNSTGGTALEGASTTLDNYTVCCNGVIKPALSCYQNTSEIVGWCGDHNCAGSSHGEVCSTCPQDCGACPINCQSDCTFAGLCNSTCPSCSNVLLACNATLGAGAKTCSNSTGGKTGLINFNVSCCNVGMTDCKNMSYCSGGSCISCTSNSANCDFDSTNGCEVADLTIDNNNCGHCGNICGQCQVCSGGSCTSITTNWGANLYGCTGPSNRCYSGACVSCGGYLYSDGCSGCAGAGGNGCWYSSVTGTSCDTTCSTHDGCVAANWNDTACYVSKALAFPIITCTSACGFISNAAAPLAISTSFCYDRTYNVPQNCSQVYSKIRLCVCQH